MLSEKSQESLQKLTPSERQNIKKMNAFGKNQFVTKRFGSKSERFGISFGLFPLWVREVLDELERGKYVAKKR